MTDDARRDFLLSALRAASLRAKMMEAELTTVGIALKSGMVTAGQAVIWLKDIGALEWIGTIPGEIPGEIAAKEDGNKMPTKQISK